MLPLMKEKTAKLRFLIKDVPGSLATVANFLSENKFNIIMSESKTLQKSRLAEWDVIVDMSQAKGGIEKLKDKFSEVSVIKNVVIIK
jgi:ACT domain-containing protein